MQVILTPGRVRHRRCITCDIVSAASELVEGSMSIRYGPKRLINASYTYTMSKIELTVSARKRSIIKRVIHFLSLTKKVGMQRGGKA
jgi:hypothetical protein